LKNKKTTNKDFELQLENGETFPIYLGKTISIVLTTKQLQLVIYTGILLGFAIGVTNENSYDLLIKSDEAEGHITRNDISYIKTWSYPVSGEE